jgi:hypothetical protein
MQHAVVSNACALQLSGLYTNSNTANWLEVLRATHTHVHACEEQHLHVSKPGGQHAGHHAVLAFCSNSAAMVLGGAVVMPSVPLCMPLLHNLHKPQADSHAACCRIMRALCS